MPQLTDRALDDLCQAVVRAQDLLAAVQARSEVLHEARSQGRRYSEMVSEEQRPLIVQMLSQVLEELSQAGAAFRRAEARALHAEGMSHESIAEVFGVTRQRVSALLKEAARAG